MSRFFERLPGSFWLCDDPGDYFVEQRLLGVSLLFLVGNSQCRCCFILKLSRVVPLKVGLRQYSESIGHPATCSIVDLQLGHDLISAWPCVYENPSTIVIGGRQMSEQKQTVEVVELDFDIIYTLGCRTAESVYQGRREPWDQVLHDESLG